MNQDIKTSEKNDALNGFVVFQIEEQRYALPVFNVERIVRMVEITPVGQDMMIGTINVEGIKLPVIDLRRIFGLPIREYDIDDQIIIVTSKQKFAFVIDGASSVIEADEKETEAADDIFPGLEYIKGILKRDDGMIQILYPESMLSDPVIKSHYMVISDRTGGDV